MDVSENRGTPRWFTMENPIKMDDLGGKPSIFGNIQIYLDHGSYWGMKWPLLGKKARLQLNPGPSRRPTEVPATAPQASWCSGV